MPDTRRKVATAPPAPCRDHHSMEFGAVDVYGLSTAFPSTDRAATAQEPGVQRAFPLMMVAAVVAGGGLRAFTR